LTTVLIAGGEAVNITSDEAVLRAGTGVADDSEDLDTQVGTLAGVTNTGDFNIEDAASGLTIATVDGTAGVTIAGGGAGDNILLSAVGGDLTINASVTTTGNGIIVGRAGNDFLLDPATTVVVETGLGRISTTTPTFTIIPHQFEPGIELFVDAGANTVEALIDRLFIVDQEGLNYRLDVDWGVPGDPNREVSYQREAALRPGELQFFLDSDAVAASDIDGKANADPVVVANNHKLEHVYSLDDFLARTDPSATVTVAFTGSFDYRGGTINDNGIRLFEDMTQPVIVRIVVNRTVDLDPPAIGIMSFAPQQREEPTVLLQEAEARPVVKTSSAEAPGFELISPLPGAAIDPQDHLELFRVTVEGEEVFVRRWDDGDASAVDVRYLPKLFGELDNDHYRLYLIRDGKKLQRFFDVLVKDGIPLPPPETAQSQAAHDTENVLADGPSDNVDLEPKADDANSGEISLRPVDLSAGQDHPIEAPDVSNVSNQHDPGNEQTFAAAAGAAAFVSGFQRSWETRVDRAMKNLGNRSLNKISRLCRRWKSSE